jgi:hypothetical protein
LALRKDQHSRHHFQVRGDGREVPEQDEHFVEWAALVVATDEFGIVRLLATAQDVVVRKQVPEAKFLHTGRIAPDLQAIGPDFGLRDDRSDTDLARDRGL